MKKLVIPTVLFSVIVVALATAALFWDKEARHAREESARTAISTLTHQNRAEEIDVHGRPYVMYQAMNLKSTVYVKMKPAEGASKETLILNNITDNDHDEIEDLVSLPYPESDATPITNDDGSFTDRAKVGGAERAYKAESSELAPGQNLRITDDTGRVVAEAKLDAKKQGHVSAVSAMDDGITASVIYEK
ncbi:hypothetical protein [Kocuria sp. TGY1127_2]|uniref:hypothetical protein n=1 Tax=Kocuria sp. TGY1127_2 TaxID=2711328 RepID=UPI0015BAA676|nr:hypothetical protein [Kocuria sp. TGY1127_2]